MRRASFSDIWPLTPLLWNILLIILPMNLFIARLANLPAAVTRPNAKSGHVDYPAFSREAASQLDAD